MSTLFIVKNSLTFLYLLVMWVGVLCKAIGFMLRSQIPKMNFVF